MATKMVSELRPYDRFRFGGSSYSVDGLRLGVRAGKVRVAVRSLSTPDYAPEELELRLGEPVEMLPADRADDEARLMLEVELLATGILLALDMVEVTDKASGYGIPDLARLRNLLLEASAIVGDEDAEARGRLFGAL